MMKNKKLIVSCLVTVAFGFGAYAQNVKQDFVNAEEQTSVLLKEIAIAKAKMPMTEKNLPLVSPRTVENGELVLLPARAWTSGFFPGNLWYLYEYTQDAKWKAEAEKYTVEIENQQFNGTTHDMGFKIFCSFGNGYRLTDDPGYKDVIIQSGKTLITRFNPKVGALRSWDKNAGTEKWDFPVIIDNMMNLELLFEATRLSGDSIYHKVAVQHANTTLKNHFRDDYSSYHVIDYNPETGAVQRKNTHQGYSDASSWTRGQAWGLYGFTMCYRYTKDNAYLRLAENISKFIFTNKNMPKDLIPYWDFDVPNIKKEPRDVSAASITASALYELSKYSANGKPYTEKANTILKNLEKSYTAKTGTNKGFILLHSTGAKSLNAEIDVPLIYADYYFLEALLRYKNL